MAEKSTLTNTTDFLKVLYPNNQIEKQFNDVSHFYNMIEKRSDFQMLTNKFGGSKAIVPLRKWRGNGNGSRAEDGDLPVAGSPGYDQAEVNLTYHYNREYVTNQMLEFAQGGEQSFLDFMSDMSADMEFSLKKDYNWKLFNTSTAYRTLINDASVSAETTFTVDSVVGLHENMLIDIYDSTNTTAQAEDVRITNINDSTKVVTVDTAVTCDDDGYVYQAGEKGLSMNGLIDGTATTGTYHGISKTDNSWWAGYAISTTASTTITDPILTSMKTRAERKGAEAKFWFTTPEIRDQIWLHLLRPDQRHMSSTITGGVKTFDYHNMPVVVDVDCPSGYIWLIDPSKIKIAQSKSGFHWAEEDGSRLYRVSGKDSWEVLLRNYSNMIVVQPNAIPYCSGIAE